MKRKALDKLDAPRGYAPRGDLPTVSRPTANKIAKRDIPKTIKNLPLELIHKISKYGEVPFIPSKDIGPLEPRDIDRLVDLRDTQHPAHGQLTQSMLSSNSVLRRSEQGPATEKQTRNEKIPILLQKWDQLNTEYKMLKAIYGLHHPATRNLEDKWWRANSVLLDA